MCSIERAVEGRAHEAVAAPARGLRSGPRRPELGGQEREEHGERGLAGGATHARVPVAVDHLAVAGVRGRELVADLDLEVGEALQLDGDADVDLTQGQPGCGAQRLRHAVRKGRRAPGLGQTGEQIEQAIDKGLAETRGGPIRELAEIEALEDRR